MSNIQTMQANEVIKHCWACDIPIAETQEHVFGQVGLLVDTSIIQGMYEQEEADFYDLLVE